MNWISILIKPAAMTHCIKYYHTTSFNLRNVWRIEIAITETNHKFGNRSRSPTR